MLLRISLIGFVSLFIYACGGTSSNESEETTDSLTVEEDTIQQVDELPAVSVWDNVSVRASADKEGKWLTSLSLGESLTFLGEEKTSENDNTYVKVRLNDGTEGWSRTEFIVPEAEAAVFINDTDIYDRPDLLTKSERSFSQMDIVAVKQTKDQWAEVVGKPSDAKWLRSGWVKTNNLSYEDVDIAMAKFAKPVLSMESSEEKAEKLEEILNNQDLTASVFTPTIKEALDVIKLNEPVDTDATSEEVAADTTTSPIN